jgi:hypothetical protein
MKRMENENSQSAETSMPWILCTKVQGTGSIEQLGRVARGVQSCQRACRCASQKKHRLCLLQEGERE